MLFLYDPEEIKFRQRLQLYGNMKLIVELYTHGQIPEGIILTCINSLFDEVIDQNVEILCQMMEKISSHVVKRALSEKHLKDQGAIKGKKKTIWNCQINLDYIEETLNKIFALRQSDQLSSRIRFKIQDLMDEYSKSWKFAIYSDNSKVDAEGFQYKYVPKDQILKEEQISPNQKQKFRKNSKGNEGYMYIKKSPAPSTGSETLSIKSPMVKLLSGLKPDSA